MGSQFYHGDLPSFGAGVNGSDIYKRKALELFIHHCMANGQGSEDFAEHRDIYQKNLQRSHGFPQKKQKLGVLQYPCLWKGCRASFENDSDRRSHMRMHVRKAQASESRENTIDSPLWLDSSSGNSAESNFDSDSSELSSLSAATSRSSSCTPNYKAVQADSKPHNFSPPIKGLQGRRDYRVPTASMRQGSLRISVTPRTLPYQSVPISPKESSTKEPELSKVNMADENQATFQRFESSGNGVNNSPTITGSGLSNGRSHPTAPSVTETDNPSENGSSSQSRTSSTISDSSTGNKNEIETQSESKLEDLVKNHVLRASPEVADLFLRAVDGQLEVSSDDNIEHLEDLTGLSLLRLLEVPHSSYAHDYPGLTSHAPSSSSGSSSSSSSSSPGQATAAPSSSSGKLGGSGGAPMLRDGSTPDGGANQMLKGHKTMAKSGASQSTKTQPLRCIHNALLPEMFSVNHETYERFRSCAGPGWNSIQHLKEHMQNHHTKKVKKANPLQCSDCQDKFQNQEELKSHKLDVDCPVRCPECLETFDAKAKRTDHHKEQHQEEETELTYREIDEVMWKKIKDNLKAYLDVVKKGPKAKGRSDPALDSWVEANIPRYMIGRSSSRTNPKLELGQWYTIFKTLAPSAEILEHPFYEYHIPGLPPRSDFIEERIIFINDTMVDSRIQAHGPPPADIQQQRDWYRGVLRESLQLAAHTVYNPRKRSASPSLHANESLSTADGSGSMVQTPAYDMSMIPVSQMGYLPNGSSVPFEPEQFLANDQQQQTSIMASLPNEITPGVTPMAGDMFDSWMYTPGSMSDGTTPHLDSRFSYSFQSVEYRQPETEAQPNPQYPSEWPGHHGQRRRT